MYDHPTAILQELELFRRLGISCDVIGCSSIQKNHQINDSQYNGILLESFFSYDLIDDDLISFFNNYNFIYNDFNPSQLKDLLTWFSKNIIIRINGHYDGYFLKNKINNLIKICKESNALDRVFFLYSYKHMLDELHPSEFKNAYFFPVYVLQSRFKGLKWNGQNPPNFLMTCISYIGENPYCTELYQEILREMKKYPKLELHIFGKNKIQKQDGNVKVFCEIKDDASFYKTLLKYKSYLDFASYRYHSIFPPIELASIGMPVYGISESANFIKISNNARDLLQDYFFKSKDQLILNGYLKNLKSNKKLVNKIYVSTFKYQECLRALKLLLANDKIKHDNFNTVPLPNYVKKFNINLNSKVFFNLSFKKNKFTIFFKIKRFLNLFNKIEINKLIKFSGKFHILSSFSNKFLDIQINGMPIRDKESIVIKDNDLITIRYRIIVSLLKRSVKFVSHE